MPGARKGAASTSIDRPPITPVQVALNDHRHRCQGHRSTEGKDQSSPEIVIQSESPLQQISDKQIAVFASLHSRRTSRWRYPNHRLSVH